MQLAIEVVQATMVAENRLAAAQREADAEGVEMTPIEPEVLIVATRDTDIVPALEIARASTAVQLELATWKGSPSSS